MISQSRHHPLLSIVGFAVLGLFAFGLLCVLVLVRPGILIGQGAEGLGIATAHLTTLGWISSLLFAATYLVGPALAGGPLWSRRLPGVHFVLHLLGLGLLMGGSAVLNPQLQSVGAGLLILGFLALLVNVYQTGNQRSIWTPANLAFHSAIFWLIITGVTALLMVRMRLGGEVPISTETLLAVHAHYGLFGFLAQALLAASLRVVPEMLGNNTESAPGDRLCWVGWGLLNGGLLLLFPAAQSGWIWPLFAVGLVIAAGILAFTARIAVTLWQNRRSVGWSEATHATGMLLLIAVVIGALATYPGSAGSAESLREWMTLYIALSLLGPFAFAILGVGQRLVPRLIWQLRYAPWSGHAQVPGIASLSRPAAGGPIYFSLLLAWGYLAAGQWIGDAEAIRLGAVLMLIAIGWFIVAVRPAILRFVVGVTPDDLQTAAALMHDRDAPATMTREPVTSKPAVEQPRQISNLQPLTLG